MKKVWLIAGCLAFVVPCKTTNVTTVQNRTDEPSSATQSGNIDVPLDRTQTGIKIPLAVGGTILSCVAIVGNVLTIYSYKTDDHLKTVYDMYILNLAAVDLCIACFSIPFYVIYSLNGTWIFGRALCKIWLAADFTFCLETVLMVMIISLDRLLYIKLGTQYITKITQRVAKLSIVATWVVSFLVYLPAIMLWDHWVGYSNVRDTECHVEFAYDFHFTIGTAVIEFFLPALGLTIINGVIYREIRRLTKCRLKIAQQLTYISSICTMAGSSGSHVSQWSHNSRKKTRKSFRSRNSQDRHNDDSWCQNDRGVALKIKTLTRNYKKATRNLAFLVALFIICWAPYTILTIVVSFCGYGCINIVLYEFSYLWLWVKSAVNPFLYAYINSKFRIKFHECSTCKVLKRFYR